MVNGFVYLWKDTKRNKFYLGSHAGCADDGYVCSNRRFLNVYRARPETCRRRILENVVGTTDNVLRSREQAWLNLIADEDLHGVRYYNEKKVAGGGNIVGALSEDRKLQHRQRSLFVRSLGYKKWLDEQSHETLEIRASRARASWTSESYRKRSIDQPKKAAVIQYRSNPSITISNIFEFCRLHNLNYGNFKTMLRGNGKIRSCAGWTGSYETN